MGLFDIFKKKEKKKEKFVPIREPRKIGPRRLPERETRVPGRPGRPGRPSRLPKPGPEVPRPGLPSPERRYRKPSPGGTAEEKISTILSELDSIKSDLREIRSKLDLLTGERSEKGYSRRY